MAKYRAIYGGGEYLIHFKYSDALNITYVTCMYGIGIPLLFPVAALNLSLTLMGECLTTAFYASQPPAIHDTLTKIGLILLKLAPIILLFNSYWMIGNKQIFQNLWSYIDEDTDPMPSGHYLGQFSVDWATPVGLMALFGVFILIIQGVFGSKL